MTAYPLTDAQIELLSTGQVAEVLGPAADEVSAALARGVRDEAGNRSVELDEAHRRLIVDALHEVSADSADPTQRASTEQLLKTLG